MAQLTETTVATSFILRRGGIHKKDKTKKKNAVLHCTMKKNAEKKQVSTLKRKEEYKKQVTMKHGPSSLQTALRTREDSDQPACLATQEGEESAFRCQILREHDTEEDVELRPEPGSQEIADARLSSRRCQSEKLDPGSTTQKKTLNPARNQEARKLLMQGCQAGDANQKSWNQMLLPPSPPYLGGCGMAAQRPSAAGAPEASPSAPVCAWTAPSTITPRPHERHNTRIHYDASTLHALNAGRNHTCFQAAPKQKYKVVTSSSSGCGCSFRMEDRASSIL
ncbi:uncharacterized protein LOC144821630 [Lissotriton helveticus]